MIDLKRVPEASKETVKVAIWVFVSAGLMAVLSWALNKPEWAQWYGLINIILFFLKELNKKK